jgi:predicted TIM-barrel fold metal-dependent hydrolase
MDDLAIVDAHHHLWDLGRNRYPWLSDEPKHSDFLGDYSALRRNYLPEDYRRDAAKFNVIKTVHVEAEMDRNAQIAETEWLTAVHARAGMPNAIVGHVWFVDPECDAKLARHASFPLVRGIRSKPVTAASPRDSVQGQPGTMQDPAWLAGFALLAKYNLSWDLRVPFWHLAEAAQVARDFPHIPIVLNHTGFPWDRSPEGLAAWRRGMEALARSPSVHVKISELGLLHQPWTVAGNRGVVLDTVAIFGIARCLFASNFPVAGLFAPYATIVNGMREILGHLPRPELEAFFAGNALRFYRIT